MQLKKEWAEELERKYGVRYRRAYRAVMKKRVVKVVVRGGKGAIWLVYSPKRKRVHLVIPGEACSCEDFYVNSLLRGNIDSCYHMIAQEIAEATEFYEELVVDKEELAEFLSDLYRKLIYAR
ncbi:MAG: hypothetical protein DRJ49_00955 [Thermoprotei archaeon]|nr:MAG: hypothetical protein DRJ49_00955 [Thermoprotei archaeon]